MAIAIKKLNKTNSILITDEQHSLRDFWASLVDNYSNITAVVDGYNNFELTYKELYETICLFSSGLQTLGLAKGNHVCLFSENSSKWLIADQAIIIAGGIDAVRGSQAPADELFCIIKHSDSKGIVVENLDTLNKLNDPLKDYPLDFIVSLSGEEISEELREKYNIYNFNQVMSLGKESSFRPASLNRDDVATIVYTSGTTNKPKGVMITHGNFLSQIAAIGDSLEIYPGETALNILPTWHIYERTCEYYFLSKGITFNYTNVANFKTDINRYNPHHIVTVPRIWESIYSGIQIELNKQPILKQKLLQFLLNSGKFHIKSKRIANCVCIENIKCSFSRRVQAYIESCLTYPLHQLGEKLLYKKIRKVLGKNLKLAISGGGALASNLEDFFETIGVNIIVGYGLTETSPVLTIRTKEINLKLSAGKPLVATEIKIVNPETGVEEDYFKTGLVMARGPQVMKGYYKDLEATNKVLSSDGWFNTGDLGWLTPKKDLVLTGRHKDLIVLSNGENVEPQPLESACIASPYIDQIVLVGQDKNCLGALICPNVDSVKNFTTKNYADNSQIYNCPDVHRLLKKELNNLIQNRAGFRAFERIHHLKLVNEPFSIENGLLTRTMKVKKAEIQKRYEHLIDEMFEK